jgi:ferredoxin
MIAPKAFELDDVDGHASAVMGEVAAEDEAQLLEAARSCPEQAIVLMNGTVGQGAGE